MKLHILIEIREITQTSNYDHCLQPVSGYVWKFFHPFL